MKRDGRAGKAGDNSGYRLEVSEYVRATTVMIKLLHDGGKLNEDEKAMINNCLELFQAVLHDWERKQTMDTR
ncbi:hypothetical protein [Candidatus Nitrospira bockiana]